MRNIFILLKFYEQLYKKALKSKYKKFFEQTIIC